MEKEKPEMGKLLKEILEATEASVRRRRLYRWVRTLALTFIVLLGSYLLWTRFPGT